MGRERILPPQSRVRARVGAGVVLLLGGVWGGLALKSWQDSTIRDYETIEALGFALDAQSFAAKYTVPDSENNGFKLLDALTALEKRV